ncbi:UDP-N-acetylglucosamine transferase subunit ALG13 homolog [Atheta coriaria]|uniref:UDP-N-acetylglucosamine transferase subunit ALG13 homolog n=1 Tax=Dalotia coriaria TaxID=877792 RepID=UPI0031F382C3
MSCKRVLVTVGTTRFDKLIEHAHSDAVLNKLESLGFTEVTYQVGNGKGDIKEKTHSVLQLDYVKYIEDFNEEIKRSDLVISHAGAGTCLEVLKAGTPLIVVINEELMDNHQLELAEQLECDNYVYYCNPKGLKNTLEKNLKDLKKYPKASKHLFRNYLNKAMGFA